MNRVDNISKRVGGALYVFSRVELSIKESSFASKNIHRICGIWH